MHVGCFLVGVCFHFNKQSFLSLLATCLLVNVQALRNLQVTLLELGMISLIFFVLTSLQ